MFHHSENNKERPADHDEMDAIERIEAACPNFRILTIRFEENGLIWVLFRYDTRVNFDFIDINSSFFDHVTATI